MSRLQVKDILFYIMYLKIFQNFTPFCSLWIRFLISPFSYYILFSQLLGGKQIPTVISTGREQAVRQHLNGKSLPIMLKLIINLFPVKS